MAIRTTAITVQTTATLLASDEHVAMGDKHQVLVHVPAAATNPVYVGGSGVTAANGVVVAAGTSFAVEQGPGDNVYAIATGGTEAVRLLETRVPPA